jgi:protocatechuate 3,4-dioxygenase beta subunit
MATQELNALQLQPVVVGDTGPAILGIKFNDLNGDGIKQANEPGLANIPILLESATSTNGVFNAGTGEVLTTTDANGAFSFTNLVPGNYVLTETTVPAGFKNTTPNPLAVTVANKNVNVFFGNALIPTGRIVGCKYLDINGDGLREGNEPGIKNVRIYLDLNGNGQRDPGEPSTLTDKNGAWSFNVTPGTYKVREERINPLVNSVNGVQSNDPNAQPLQTNNFLQSTPPNNIPALDVTVAAGQTFACAQVGDAPLYQIVVNKFRDIDGSGTRNTVNGVTEPPIVNVPFILDLNGNGKWDSGSEPIAITDANGVATFKNLPAGNNYSVLEIFPSTLPNTADVPAALRGIPSGNLNAPLGTTPNPTLVSAPGPQAQFQGSISKQVPLLVADSTYTLKQNDPKFVDTNGDGVQQVGETSIPATGVRPIFAAPTATLPATNPQPSLTFSPVAATGGVGSNAGVGNTRPNINVFKYNDLNGNGRYEPTQGESPISGVTVFLDTNNNGVLNAGEQQVQTNSQGKAAFTNLAAGNYVVKEVVPSGFSPSTTATVNVALSTQDANVTFANTPNSNITGCKFEDFNQNGYRDGNEPAIPGVTVFLDTNGNGVLDANEPSTTTDQFGTFKFTNLTPGTYKLREVTPPGYFQTTKPLDIVLGANQTFTCAVVGNSRRYDLAVPKFRDDNRNGVRDGSEPPLVGIPFTLDLNKNGVYDPATEPLVRTDANGIALFPNLSPGTYSVLEVFDPSVQNPYPIPTGPNPVSFDVPGPNAVPTQTGVVSAKGLSDPLTGATDTGTGTGTATTDTTTATPTDTLINGSLLNTTVPASDLSSFVVGQNPVVTTLSDPNPLQTVSSVTNIVTTPQNPLDASLLLATTNSPTGLISSSATGLTV